jgi:hypothetical protein
MNILSLWLSRSTMSQKLKLAELAGSSLPSLRLAAKGYRKKGALDLSVDFAARLEEASAVLIEESEGLPLPILSREKLCKACAKCPYQQACNADTQDLF